MKFDLYSLKGRVLPAIFTMILPIMIFNHFYISEELSKFVGEVLGAKVLSNLTISVICLYFLSEAGRFMGKNVFEKNFFKDERQMPTTNFLMHHDTAFSNQYKEMIRSQINSDFKLLLPSKDEEDTNEQNARTRIVEVMALIRKKLHGNKFLLQHNIEYGAMRNAIGGAIIGSFLSLANIGFFTFVIEVDLPVIISWITLSIYILLIMLSKIIITFYGNNYAKILFREYMGH